MMNVTEFKELKDTPVTFGEYCALKDDINSRVSDLYCECHKLIEKLNDFKTYRTGARLKATNDLIVAGFIPGSFWNFVSNGGTIKMQFVAYHPDDWVEFKYIGGERDGKSVYCDGNDVLGRIKCFTRA